MRLSQEQIEAMNTCDKESIKITRILELRNFLNSIQDRSLRKTILNLNQKIGMFCYSKINFAQFKEESLDIITNAKQGELSYRSLTTLESISEFFRYLFNCIDSISIQSTYTFGAQTFFNRKRYLEEPNHEILTPNSDELNTKLDEIEEEFTTVYQAYSSA
jgi:hypothetical protein